MNLLHKVFENYSNIKDIRMFDFGDQESYSWNGFFNGIAKNYWENLGLDYISLDLSGLNGSLKRDITDSVDDLGQFDIVNNFGSSEHVYPLDKQYQTFKNLHKLCKIGGYMIHHIPPTGYWLEHGFFTKLVERNSYEIVYYKYIDTSQLISCILRKNNDYFIEKDNFPFEEIEWDEDAPLKDNYRIKK